MNGDKYTLTRDKAMTKTERTNIYKRLSVHPTFDLLPERYQEALTYMAAGYTGAEIMALYKRSHGIAWTYREAIFKRLGLRVFEDGYTRAMTMEEIKRKRSLEKPPFSERVW